MKTIIHDLAVHYFDERTDKTDTNDGLLWGIYTYETEEEDMHTDWMYNSSPIDVKWYATEEERNENLLK